MSEPDWPEYGVGASSDHIYAIGVLIANWNDVEAQMFRLMKSLIRNDKLATGLFYNMHNADRLNIIKLLSDDLEDDQDKDYVATFVRHASLCNQNRNILAHTEFSTILFSDDIMLGQEKQLMKLEKHLNLRGILQCGFLLQ